MMHEDGELPRREDMTVHALHHCEIIGLQRTSARAKGGYRLYANEVVLRLHGAQALRERLGVMRRVLKGMRQAALDDWLAGVSMISNFELSFGAAGLRRAYLTLPRGEGGRCGLPRSGSQPCLPSRPTASAPRKDGLGTGGSFRIMRAGVGATWQQRTQ